MKKYFVCLSIKGDNLMLEKIAKDVPLKAELYEKGKVYLGKYNKKHYHPQKTNRWVYSWESNDNENLNSIIKRIYEDIKPYIKSLQFYSRKFNTVLDVVIYVDDNTSRFNEKLSKESIKILDVLNVKLSLTFVDF